MIQLIWNERMIALKSPEFGDSLSFNLNVVARRSMNQTLYTYVEPNENKILNFDFRDLSRVQVRNYFDFMRLSRGKNVTLIDHNNDRWYGDITSQPVSSSHDGINKSTLNITFEGIKVA
jgi:hypothetical protein